MLVLIAAAWRRRRRGDGLQRIEDILVHVPYAAAEKCQHDNDNDRDEYKEEGILDQALTFHNAPAAQERGVCQVRIVPNIATKRQAIGTEHHHVNHQDIHLSCWMASLAVLT